jgi:hypothetical protein
VFSLLDCLHIKFQAVPEVLKKSAAFIYTEEGGSISLRNVSNYPRYCTLGVIT